MRKRRRRLPTPLQSDAAGRSRRLALRCVTVLLVAATFVCPGCKASASRGKDVREAYETTALAWVEALGAGDGAGSALEGLTDGVLIFRTVGEDKKCDGRVSGRGDAFAVWLGCVRAKPELQAFSQALQLYRRLRREEPGKGPEIVQYLPHVVGGGDAWNRFVNPVERERAQAAFDAARKEAGGGGVWTTVATSWLYTTMVVRLQLVGAADAPRVHAVLVDVSRTAD